MLLLPFYHQNRREVECVRLVLNYSEPFLKLHVSIPVLQCCQYGSGRNLSFFRKFNTVHALVENLKVLHKVSLKEM